MLEVAAPRTDRNGKFSGFIGSAVDVTDKKLAQQALENVSGKLIEAQEAERSRIARELHDDICQRLAMLSLELEQASEAANGSRGRLMEIRQRYSEVALDVQALSHELHSSKLQYLGIVAALRAFCQEFSEQQFVNVNFTHVNVPARLPGEVPLCLFRIAQEALHNAVKHSGTTEFAVHLLGTQGEIELEIRDAGTGFDVEVATRGRGLGLMSMQERVHLVNGFLSIESKPNCGTRVIVRVPLGAAATRCLSSSTGDVLAS
jgi:signal transduction histidine kinase